MASAVRGIHGDAVKAFRERRGLSLAALGKTLGMSAQGVWRWENGKAQIPSATVPALAETLGVTICELYGVDEGHGAPPAPAERPGQRWARRLAEEVADMSEADQQFVRELADALNGYRTRLLAEEGAPEATESLTNPNIRSTT